MYYSLYRMNDKRNATLQRAASQEPVVDYLPLTAHLRVFYPLHVNTYNEDSRIFSNIFTKLLRFRSNTYKGNGMRLAVTHHQSGSRFQHHEVMFVLTTTSSPWHEHNLFIFFPERMLVFQGAWEISGKQPLQMALTVNRRCTKEFLNTEWHSTINSDSRRPRGLSVMSRPCIPSGLKCGHTH